MFVHSLTVELEQSGLGISLDIPLSPLSSTPSSFLVNHLIYADDLVLIAESTNDLQKLIDIVNLWCCKHRIEANLLKTEVMHVRQPLVPRSKFNFKFGQRKINFCQTYKYLGLTIHQFLDFGKMSNSFSDPADRALSSVIGKMIKNKGFPFNVFEKLYNCCVTTITDYAHEVIGFHQYSGSDNIHTKAIRSYLGVGRSANLCAIRYEMALPEPKSRTHIRMLRFYYRMLNMENCRLTKKIYLYDQYLSQCNPQLSTWSNEMSVIVSKNNLSDVVFTQPPKIVLRLLENSLLSRDQYKQRSDCLKSDKLRTYNSLFSSIVPYFSVISYTRLCLPFILRKRLAQLRLGCLPIRIETDRYTRPIVHRDQRYCLQPECENIVSNLSDEAKHVENEYHFIMKCSQYDQLRHEMFAQIQAVEFLQMNDDSKFIFLLTNQSVAKLVAQFIVNAFDARLSQL